jgi:hypothetical protein
MNISLPNLLSYLPTAINEWMLLSLNKKTESDDEEEIINNSIISFSALPMALRKEGYSHSQAPIYAHFSLLDICRISFADHLIRQYSTLMLKELCKLSDDEEKTSLMKGIALLDIKGELLNFVIDLTRTNSTELFAAIALNNTYPAKFFPEANFNQLVLKTLFSDLNIKTISQLKVRRNEELTRMALDYKEERIKANRSIPESLDWALNN